jgi:hypothetical protein
MASLTLLHSEEMFTLPALQAMTKCSLFQNNPTLLGSPYRVQSSVSLSIFREFLSALEGNPINITDTNYTELERLCDEFGFSEIAAKLLEFRPRWTSKKQKIRMHADELQRLKKSQINTPTSLRFCRMKSNSSPQILDVLSVKFHHFDLLQREFRHFQKKFLL